MVSSVTEGEDKPLKYPLMFRACELVLVNKIDLLEHLDYDLDLFLHHLDAVNPGVRADARQRAHRRGRRRVARLARGARGARGGGRVTAPAGVDLVGAAPRRAHAGQRGAVRGRGRPHRAAVPPHGRALRGRRAARGARRRRRRPLRRAPRHRRVRAPGDRRQARAARHRAVGRGRRARAPRSTLLAEPDDIAIAFGDAAGGRGRRRASPRDRGCLTIAFARRRRRVGVRAAGARTRSSRRSWPRRSTTCSGSSCTCSSSTAACSRAARERAVHDAGASSFLYPFLDEREDDLDAVVADVARVGAHEGGRGRRAARADAGRGPRRRCSPPRRRCATCFARGGRRARARQRRLGHRRDGRRRRPARAAGGRLAAAPGDRPHRGHGDPHRAGQRHRHRGAVLAPGHRPRPRRATSLLAHLDERRLGQRPRRAGRGAPARPGHDRARRLRRRADRRPRGWPTTCVVTRSEHIPRIQEAQASALHVLRELVEVDGERRDRRSCPTTRGARPRRAARRDRRDGDDRHARA